MLLKLRQHWPLIRSKCIKIKFLNNSQQILRVAPFNLHRIWDYKSIWPESCCDFQPLEALAFWSAGSGCSSSSVLCTLYSAAVLLYCSPPHRLPRSDPVPARQPERHDLKWPNTLTPSPVTLTLSLVTTLTPVEGGGGFKSSGSGQFFWVFLSWTLYFR